MQLLRAVWQQKLVGWGQLGAFAHKPLVLWEHLKSDMTVLGQDIECLENLQAGMHAVDFGFVHGAYEAQLIDFHAVCKSLCSIAGGGAL